METGSDLLPVSTAVAVDYSLPQKHEESPVHPVPVGQLINSEILENLDVFLAQLYQGLFSDVPTKTNVLEHVIDVGNSAPIKQHGYRVNPEKREKLLSKFLPEQGITQHGNSPWSSPCLLVPKVDGSLQFCSNFEKLNDITKSDSYPLPRVNNCVDRVGAAKYISKFDLLKGYWQVPQTGCAKESAFGLFS